LRILFVGDVVGLPGRRVLRSGLAALRPKLLPDLVIVNGENSAGGNGLTPATTEEMFRAGCDVVTTGNHVWDRKEIVPYFASHERLLRPANYPAGAPGRGFVIVPARDGTPVLVANLMGRVFMPAVDDPFRCADALLLESGSRAPVKIVDFHAEATSEKIAFSWYVDGKVSAVVGTHTHVPTADERVLPRGAACITDVGMTGPHDSVIGVEKTEVLERFLTQRPVRFSTARDDARLQAVLIEVSPSDGRAASIRRIEFREGDRDEVR
jgi:2',3'-cyclic-nucleotide 2'-phosphodiesterase